jgi:DNA-binding GntR family transcriptional regulator
MLAASMLTASTRRREETDSLNGAAYQAIRDRIVRLELAPASVIDERKLAEEMELGLTPVRHALRRLALENLVVILPRRGTLVADLNPADLSKIFEMRVELEALAALLAASRLTPQQAEALEALADETRAAQLAAQVGSERGEAETSVPPHAG